MSPEKIEKLAHIILTDAALSTENMKGRIESKAQGDQNKSEELFSLVFVEHLCLLMYLAEYIALINFGTNNSNSGWFSDELLPIILKAISDISPHGDTSTFQNYFFESLKKAKDRYSHCTTIFVPPNFETVNILEKIKAKSEGKQIYRKGIIQEFIDKIQLDILGPIAFSDHIRLTGFLSDAIEKNHYHSLVVDILKK